MPSQVRVRKRQFGCQKDISCSKTFDWLTDNLAQSACGRPEMRRSRNFHPRCNTMNSNCSAIDWPLSLNRSRTRKNGLSREARVLKLMGDRRVRFPRGIAGGVPLASGRTESSGLLPPAKSVMTRIDVQR